MALLEDGRVDPAPLGLAASGVDQRCVRVGLDEEAVPALDRRLEAATRLALRRRSGSVKSPTIVLACPAAPMVVMAAGA